MLAAERDPSILFCAYSGDSQHGHSRTSKVLYQGTAQRFIFCSTELVVTRLGMMYLQLDHLHHAKLVPSFPGSPPHGKYYKGWESWVGPGDKATIKTGDGGGLATCWRSLGLVVGIYPSSPCSRHKIGYLLGYTCMKRKKVYPHVLFLHHSNRSMRSIRSCFGT